MLKEHRTESMYSHLISNFIYLLSEMNEECGPPTGGLDKVDSSVVFLLYYNIFTIISIAYVNELSCGCVS